MSYIIKTFRAPESVKNYLDTLMVHYNQTTQQFFIHILFGTLHTLKREEEGWVPVSYSLMKKEWKKEEPDWGLLVEDNLIEVKVIHVTDDGREVTYSKDSGKSREFRVTLEILNEVREAYPKTTEEFIDCQYFNLMTGKRMNQFKRHSLTDENGNSIPELIQNSIKSIKRCVVNDKALREFLDGVYAECLWGKGTEKDMRRYINDEHCYNQLRQTGIKKLEGDLIEYYPSYESQMSGRISEQGGGLQSCSREMKQAAFSDIPNVKNYDLKSSQVWGLIQWFEAASVDTKWLKEYLAKDKQEYADAIGISKDGWKRCFMALIMGGCLPKNLKDENIKDSNLAIVCYLMEEANEDVDKAIEFLNKFINVTAGLRKSLEKWQKWLLEKYIPLVSTYPKGKQYITNKTGKSFCVSEYKTPDGKWKNLPQFKRRVSAFLLQGNEAAFIHHLTWVSEHYNFEVLSNQHDGLIIVGIIPEEAIAYARKESGLMYASLEEKPFV